MNVAILLRGHSFRTQFNLVRGGWVAETPKEQVETLTVLRRYYPKEDLYMCTNRSVHSAQLLKFNPRNLSTTCVVDEQRMTFINSIRLIADPFSYDVIYSLRFDMRLKARIPTIAEGVDFAFLWREHFPTYRRQNRSKDFWWRQQRRVSDTIHAWRPSATAAWLTALSRPEISPDRKDLHLAYNVLRRYMNQSSIGFLYDEYHSSVSACISFNPLYVILPRDLACRQAMRKPMAWSPPFVLRSPNG